MKYLIAILCPPLAILMCGRVGAAMLNVLLWLMLIIPGILHAWIVIADHHAQLRNERLVRAVQQQR